MRDDEFIGAIGSRPGKEINAAHAQIRIDVAHSEKITGQTAAHADGGTLAAGIGDEIVPFDILLKYPGAEKGLFDSAHRHARALHFPRGLEDGGGPFNNAMPNGVNGREHEHEDEHRDHDFEDREGLLALVLRPRPRSRTV